MKLYIHIVVVTAAVLSNCWEDITYIIPDNNPSHALMKNRFYGLPVFMPEFIGFHFSQTAEAKVPVEK